MWAEISLFNDLRGDHHGQKLLLRKNGKATRTRNFGDVGTSSGIRPWATQQKASAKIGVSNGICHDRSLLNCDQYVLTANAASGEDVCMKTLFMFLLLQAHVNPHQGIADVGSGSFDSESQRGTLARNSLYCLPNWLVSTRTKIGKAASHRIPAPDRLTNPCVSYRETKYFLKTRYLG